MKIAPSIRSLDAGYSWKQNNNDLRARMQPCLGRAKVTPRLRNAWRIRNRAKRIIASIQLCHGKKTYSHKQHHMSTQAHPKDMATQQIARATKGVKLLAKSSLKNDEHRKSSGGLFHLKKKKKREMWLLGSEGELLRSSKKGEDWIPRGTLDLFGGRKSWKRDF